MNSIRFELIRKIEDKVLSETSKRDISFDIKCYIGVRLEEYVNQRISTEISNNIARELEWKI